MTVTGVKVAKGDRVRVVLEGEVTDAGQHGDWGDWFDVSGGTVSPTGRAVQSVEVLPKPLKVGDIIDADAGGSFANLPIGTLVSSRSDHDQPHYVRNADKAWSSVWVSTVKRGTLEGRRKVLYLPTTKG